MNRKRLLYFTLFFLLSSSSFGQSFSLDTINVSQDAPRNIHLTRQKTTITESEPVLATNQEQSIFDKSKVRYGINLGLSLSRSYSAFNFGPQAAYQFNDYFMGGAGLKYYYIKSKTTRATNKNNLFGINLFGYTYPLRFITFFAQPELNYLWSTHTTETTGEVSKTNGFTLSLLIGGGLRLGRSHITLNYDLIQNINSPYPRGLFFGMSTFF